MNSLAEEPGAGAGKATLGSAFLNIVPISDTKKLTCKPFDIADNPITAGLVTAEYVRELGKGLNGVVHEVEVNGQKMAMKHHGGTVQGRDVLKGEIVNTQKIVEDQELAANSVKAYADCNRVGEADGEAYGEDDAYGEVYEEDDPVLLMEVLGGDCKEQFSRNEESLILDQTKEIASRLVHLGLKDPDKSVISETSKLHNMKLCNGRLKFFDFGQVDVEEGKDCEIWGQWFTKFRDMTDQEGNMTGTDCRPVIQDLKGSGSTDSSGNGESSEGISSQNS